MTRLLQVSTVCHLHSIAQLLELAKSSATYINTHGVVKSRKNVMKKKLKGQLLSLQADEATNNTYKILNVNIFYCF